MKLHIASLYSVLWHELSVWMYVGDDDESLILCRPEMAEVGQLSTSAYMSLAMVLNTNFSHDSRPGLRTTSVTNIQRVRRFLSPMYLMWVKEDIVSNGSHLHGWLNFYSRGEKK